MKQATCFVCLFLIANSLRSTHPLTMTPQSDNNFLASSIGPTPTLVIEMVSALVDIYVHVYKTKIKLIILVNKQQKCSKQYELLICPCLLIYLGLVQANFPYNGITLSTNKGLCRWRFEARILDQHDHCHHVLMSIHNQNPTIVP